MLLLPLGKSNRNLEKDPNLSVKSQTWNIFTSFLSHLLFICSSESLNSFMCVFNISFLRITWTLWKWKKHLMWITTFRIDVELETCRFNLIGNVKPSVLIFNFGTETDLMIEICETICFIINKGFTQSTFLLTVM